MSIFDVIRYPISEPPRVEEIENLPVDIFNNWMHKVANWNYGSDEYTQHDIGMWYYIYYESHCDKFPIVQELEILRRIIAEYEG